MPASFSGTQVWQHNDETWYASVASPDGMQGKTGT